MWNGVFLPRAMLKGSKRSFVVVVFLGGVESWAKMFQMEQKIFEKKFSKQKICKKEQKMFVGEQNYVTEWM